MYVYSYQSYIGVVILFYIVFRFSVEYGWHRFDGREYWFSASKPRRVDYWRAKDHCESLNAQLLVLNSPEEFEFVNDTLQNYIT